MIWSPSPPLFFCQPSSALFCCCFSSILPQNLMRETSTLEAWPGFNTDSGGGILQELREEVRYMLSDLRVGANRESNNSAEPILPTPSFGQRLRLVHLVLALRRAALISFQKQAAVVMLDSSTIWGKMGGWGNEGVEECGRHPKSVTRPLKQHCVCTHLLWNSKA